MSKAIVFWFGIWVGWLCAAIQVWYLMRGKTVVSAFKAFFVKNGDTKKAAVL